MVNNLEHDIEILIGKYISGNASDEEIIQLKVWKDHSEVNQLEYKNYVNAWEKSVWLSNEIILSDKIKLAGDYTRYLSKQLQKKNRRLIFYKLVAVLAFPLALFIVWMYFGVRERTGINADRYTEVFAPAGHISKCLLPDGSEVWLNSGSTVAFNADSFNHGLPEISLKGEAYFDIIPKEGKFFKVKTESADILVTGTTFNIRAYPEESVFEAVLSTGIIQLQFKTSSHQIVEMKPDQQVVFDKRTQNVEVNEVDAEMLTSWRKGELLFKDATLDDLIKEMERIYEISFHLEPANLGEFRFRGMISYNNNLIQALEKIKKTSGIEYFIENNEVWLKKVN
jgi:transmembrane sensor